MAELNANINLRGRDELSRKLDNVKKKTDRFSTSLKKTKTSADKINKSLKKTEQRTAKLSGTMKKAVGVFAAFFALKAVKQFIDIGGAMSDLTAAADEMLERFDKTANTALPALRAATRNLITDLDLLKASNQLLATGLGDQLDGFEDVAAIMELVDRRATATGVSFEKVWKQFISGARNAKIGSDNTVRAILNLDKGIPIIEAVNDQLTKTDSPAKNAADKIRSIGVAFKNLRTTLAKKLVDSASFNKLLESIEIAFSPENIEKWASSIESGFSTMTTFFSKYGKTILALTGIVAGGVITIKVGKGIQALAGVATGIGGLGLLGKGRSFLRGFREDRELGGHKNIFKILKDTKFSSLGEKASKTFRGLKFAKVAIPLAIIIGVIEGIIAVVQTFKAVSDKLKARGTSLKVKIQEAWAGIKGFIDATLGRIIRPVIQNFKNVIDAIKKTSAFKIILDGLKIGIDKYIKNIKFLLNLPKLLIDKASDLIIKALDSIEKLPGAGDAIRKFRQGKLDDIGKKLRPIGLATSFPTVMTKAEKEAAGEAATARTEARAEVKKAEADLLALMKPSFMDFRVLRRFDRAVERGTLLPRNLPAPSGFGTGLMTRLGGEPTGIGEIPEALQRMTALAAESRERFQASVDGMASSLDIGRTAAELFAQALANGTEGLKQLGPLIAGAFKTTGAGFIGEAGSIATKGIRTSIAGSAMSTLGKFGANFGIGVGFSLVGGLLGSLFKEKEDAQVVELKKISRNTDRSSELLSQLLGAPSDFIFPNVSQLTFDDMTL